ncbi:MAG: SUMF1/EgtB/PvdO family nonheme iron enzyme [Candidatus Eremiobacteraeota bacterium]|nr:SUMF1/EgtB/PvdO family nonheme iron enzyme [Candidatus Eremiobacteraeota bacterium]
MLKVAAHPRSRSALIDWYLANRRRSAEIFDLVAADSFEARPIRLRHPIVFYEGHLPAFSYITLVRGALAGPSLDEGLERLFQRGIDPDDDAAAAKSAPATWPKRDEVRAFADRCDREVIGALESFPDQSERCIEAANTILEHEQMHHETLLYIIHQLPNENKRRPASASAPSDGKLPPYARAAIPAGIATLGARHGDIPFGWDNEFGALRVDVPAFEIDKHSVTNAAYLEFVQAGGPPPPFWVLRDGVWHQRALFDEIPLPQAWPAYVTLDQATAFARWKGMRLPTEPEFHRAAYAAPEGEERRFPWGDETPDSSRGNFDFARWDPVAVGSYPSGVSAWGVHDLVGNGWEWTSTPFEPLPGFAPMASYPLYSVDFFDAKHYVVKGASAVTARDLVRRSLRNWFRPNYPFIYAKFRCVS